MDPWPFSQPKNEAVITVWSILHGVDPILHVYHSDQDGSWSFMSGKGFSVKDAALVSLQEVANRDPTIAELADLPLGWKATRTAVGGTWLREPYVEADD
jgi:hypothetical protein